MFKQFNMLYVHFVKFLREDLLSRSDSSVDDLQGMLLQHFPFYRARAYVHTGDVRAPAPIQAAKAHGPKV